MDKESPGGALECGSADAAFWMPSLAKAAAPLPHSKGFASGMLEIRLCMNFGKLCLESQVRKKSKPHNYEGPG